jgi:hypothetical protein
MERTTGFEPATLTLAIRLTQIRDERKRWLTCESASRCDAPVRRVSRCPAAHPRPNAVEPAYPVNRGAMTTGAGVVGQLSVLGS